jgi:glycosyltransferase involved in cell wall biosynthesis
VLVQPGADNTFNEFRLPGKLPEFFAMDRPVLLPRTNLGRFVRHHEDAWVLDKVDALGVVDAVLQLRGDTALRERLAAGAVAFAREHFDWKRNARALADFYQKISDRQKEETDVSAVAAS